MYADWTPNTDVIIVLGFALLFWGWSAWMIRNERKKGR